MWGIGGIEAMGLGLDLRYVGLDVGRESVPKV